MNICLFCDIITAFQKGMYRMDEMIEKKLMNKESLDYIINYLKDTTYMFLSDCRYLLTLASIEDRDIEHNLEIIEEVEHFKEDLFLGCLGSYNEFLREKNLITSNAKSNIGTHRTRIDSASHDMKATGILAAGATLLFPKLSLIALALSIPRLGIDSFEIKLRKELIDLLEEFRDSYDSSQRELFQFVDAMRTDYHHSKKEFKELRQKAKAGEEIIDDLIKMLQPERIGLALPEEASNMNDESRKVYTK